MVSKKGVAMVVAAALLLSIGGLCVKMIPWQPLSINSFRSFISVGILLVFARLTRRRLRLTGGVVLGGLAVCGATALYTVATKLTTAGNAVLLQFTAPIFVILCSWAVFRERPKRLDLAVLRLCVRRGVLLFPGQLGKRALPGGCDRRAGGDMLCLGLSAQQDSGGRPSVVYHPGTEYGGGNRSALVGAGDSV